MSTELKRPEWIPAGSEMAERVVAFDWASTSLGPLETWPLSLRNIVSNCLATSFPLLITWGPELIKIYNDGYAAMIGPEKHPRALGQPASEVWTEIWDTIGPMFDSVLTTGVATWSEDECLTINRHGYPEECYFNFSYSPMYDESGRINGVLDIAIETTQAVVSQRRMVCIADLNAALAAADVPTIACVEAIGVLSKFRSDVVACDIVLQIEDDLVPMASNRRFQHASLSLVDIRKVLDDARPRVFGEVADGRAGQYAVPFVAKDGASGVIVVTLSQSLPFDAEYRRFVEVVAQTIGASVDRAQRRSDAVGQLQQVNETLQRAMLPNVVENETFAARYLPAANHLSVGGDWYDVVELPGGRRAMVVGDCVGHDLAAATAMGQLRSASRALLLEAHDPASTVTALDSFAESIEGGNCASVVCLVIDHATATITYCRAGHPPPLLVGVGEVQWLDQLGGPLLGVVPGGKRHNVAVPFTPGDTLVLYTDGLVEQRGRAVSDRSARLAEWIAAADRSDLVGLADGLLAEMLTDVPEDDVVLVVKTLGSASEPDGPT